MNANKYRLGIDIGGTNIKFGIIDDSGLIVARKKIETITESNGDLILPLIVENIGIILKQAHFSISFIESIGIGIPGTTDIKNGIALLAPNIHWINVEVRKFIHKYYNIPVFVSQDSRASAWGEFIFGAGKGLNQIVSITLGTGIGCGLIIDGKIFHGSLNTAGEFGHQIVEEQGVVCNCGRQGCLEAYVGGPALLKATLEIPGIESLSGKKSDEISIMDLYVLAQRGNLAALEKTKLLVKYLGIGLVNLINLTSPQLISITGGISNAPDNLLYAPLVNYVRERAYPQASNIVKIVKSKLGEDAPLIGLSALHLA